MKRFMQRYRLDIHRPNKDWEGILFLGFNFWTYNQGYRKYHQRYREHYNSIYIFFDIYWYRMGFQFIYNIRENKNYKEYK